MSEPGAGENVHESAALGYPILPGPVGEVTIERGHALELVEQVPTFDLLVTDPPYAMGGGGAEHAMSATVATVLRESAHKLRKGGWAIVFAASSWRSTYYMIEAVRGVLEPVRMGTWVKPASRSKVRTPGWAWASVNVIVMRRPGKNPPGVPVPTLDWICEPPLIVGRRAQLPPAVAEWAVAPFAAPGGLAFDPFAGSGALLRAAADCGMHTLGFEIEGSDVGYVPPRPCDYGWPEGCEYHDPDNPTKWCEACSGVPDAFGCNEHGCDRAWGHDGDHAFRPRLPR